MPDAVLRLPRLDEWDTNDKQNVPAEDVFNKAFTVLNFASAPLCATLSSLVMKAQTRPIAEYKAYPNFNPRFEECHMSVLVSLAVAQQLDLAKFDVKVSTRSTLSFLKPPRPKLHAWALRESSRRFARNLSRPTPTTRGLAPTSSPSLS